MAGHWQEYRDKQIERAKLLDDDALARATSRAMITVEARVQVTADRMCAEVMASGENPSDLAYDMSEVQQSGHMLKTAHAVLTRAVSKRLGWPIPTEGDR